MTTLAEQLGTRPTSAEANTASSWLPERNAAKASSPTVSRTSTSANVIRKMKRLTCTVCETALITIDPAIPKRPPAWLWLWSWQWP